MDLTDLSNEINAIQNVWNDKMEQLSMSIKDYAKIHMPDIEPYVNTKIEYPTLPHLKRRSVLILGNGFDLNLGRKTSYKDFYESEYCPKTYPAPLIWHLNERWKNNMENVKWYNLESELSNYYHVKIEPNKGPNDIVSEDEKKVLDVFRHKNALISYEPHVTENLETINKLIERGIILHRPLPSALFVVHKDLIELTPKERDEKAFNLIIDGLQKYLISVENEDIDKDTYAYMLLEIFAKKHKDEVVKIYSFNYTGIVPLTEKIQYVHGCCKDGNIVLGTKDEKMEYGYDFLLKAYNPNFHPPRLVFDLLDADEITIFGHSLGENDSQYFKSFFNKLTDVENPTNKVIHIITKDNASILDTKKALMNMTEHKLSELFTLNTVKISATEN